MRRAVYGLLAVVACHSARPVPMTPAMASRVAPFQVADTVVETQTSEWNVKNPLAVVAIYSIRLHGVLLGTCVFGMVTDGSRVSFPGNGVDCGKYYRIWAGQ